MRTYSREDAPKTQGRTAATRTVPAQEHRDHTALCIAVECAAVISEPGLFDR